jgi:hypothetical protein
MGKPCSLGLEGRKCRLVVDAGARRRRIEARMARTIGPDTGTSASWKVMARACHTTRPPIFISLSWRLVRNKSIMGLGKATSARKTARLAAASRRSLRACAYSGAFLRPPRSLLREDHSSGGRLLTDNYHYVNFFGCNGSRSGIVAASFQATQGDLIYPPACRGNRKTYLEAKGVDQRVLEQDIDPTSAVERLFFHDFGCVWRVRSQRPSRAKPQTSSRSHPGMAAKAIGGSRIWLRTRPPTGCLERGDALGQGSDEASVGRTK